MEIQGLHLFAPDRVLRSYKDGLVIRTIDADFSHEMGQTLSQLNSATYIQEGIPISLFSPSKIGLLLEPAKLFVPFAFKTCVYTGKAHTKKGARIFLQEVKKYSPAKLNFTTRSIALVDGRMPHKCYTTLDCTTGAIAEKIQRMHKNRPTSLLKPNKLLIRVKPDISPQTDAVIGIVIPSSAFPLIAIMGIYLQILEQFPGRSFYHYDSGKGNLKSLDFHQLLMDKSLEQQKKLTSIACEYVAPAEESSQKALEQYASNILVTCSIHDTSSLHLFSKNIKLITWYDGGEDSSDDDSETEENDMSHRYPPPLFFYQIDIVNGFKTSIDISQDDTSLCKLSPDTPSKEGLAKQVCAVISTLAKKQLEDLSISSASEEKLTLTQDNALGVMLINPISEDSDNAVKIDNEVSEPFFNTLIEALDMTDHYRLPLFFLDCKTTAFEPYKETALKIVQDMGVKLGKMRAKL